MLAFHEVSKRLGNAQIFAGLNLTLPATGGTALVGESGSGKSTLLGLALGLLEPDSGHIEVLGTRLGANTVRDLRLRIGYAVQETGLFPHLCVHDNLTLQGRLNSIDSGVLAERAQQLATAMNLDVGLLARYPGELSGGQQQRAGICRAMMLEPELLLLDEPFSGLDVVTRSEIYARFLASAEAQGTRYVLVTHDLNEAHRLCPYVVILENGKVVQAGATDDVIAAPQPGYVERLVTAHRSHVGRA